MPTDERLLYVTVGVITEAARADKESAPALIHYTVRLPEEFATLALREMVVAHPRIIDHALFREWIMQNRDLFLTYIENKGEPDGHRHEEATPEA